MNEVKVIFVIDGQEYRWSGWFGSQLKSVERRRLPIGHVRHMVERYFHVAHVKRVGFRRYELSWAMALPRDAGAANTEVRALKNDLLARG